jgi:hypothetical protein
MTKREAANLLIKSLGLTDDEAKAIVAKATDEQLDGLAARAEYDAIAAEKARLEGDLAKAKPFEDWYGKNAAAIQELQNRHARYVERYGDLDGQGGQGGNGSQGGGNGNGQPNSQHLTKDELAAALKQKDEHYSNVILALTTIQDKHIRGGFNKALDVAAVTDLAAKSYGGNLQAAYDAWIAPDVEAKRNEAAEAAVNKRVEEEVQKRMSTMKFPGGDGTSSDADSRSAIFRSADAKADRNAIRQGLLETARTGKYERVQ